MMRFERARDRNHSRSSALASCVALGLRSRLDSTDYIQVFVPTPSLESSGGGSMCAQIAADRVRARQAMRRIQTVLLHRNVEIVSILEDFQRTLATCGLSVPISATRRTAMRGNRYSGLVPVPPSRGVQTGDMGNRHMPESGSSWRRNRQFKVSPDGRSLSFWIPASAGMTASA